MSWLDGKELGQLLQRKLSRIRQTNNVLCAVHDSFLRHAVLFQWPMYKVTLTKPDLAPTGAEYPTHQQQE